MNDVLAFVLPLYAVLVVWTVQATAGAYRTERRALAAYRRLRLQRIADL